MHSLDQADGSDRTGRAKDAHLAPADGVYLTDGKSLFRVERSLMDGPLDEWFVELEDCGTLELIFCSARSVAALDLRAVKPQVHTAT